MALTPKIAYADDAGDRALDFVGDIGEQARLGFGRFLGAFTPERDLAGFVCYGPTPDTDGTFDLYWLAVDPALAGSGAGTLLLSEVEQRLRSNDARMMVAETSSRDDYESARWFYARRGYTEAGRVADFYAWSDDRIIFTKRLDPAAAGSARHTPEHQGVNR